MLAALVLHCCPYSVFLRWLTGCLNVSFEGAFFLDGRSHHYAVEFNHFPEVMGARTYLFGEFSAANWWRIYSIFLQWLIMSAQTYLFERIFRRRQLLLKLHCRTYSVFHRWLIGCLNAPFVAAFFSNVRYYRIIFLRNGCPNVSFRRIFLGECYEITQLHLFTFLKLINWVSNSIL